MEACPPSSRKTGAASGTSGDNVTTTAADSSSKTSSVCGRASKLGSKSAAHQSRMDSSASLYSSKDNPLMIKQSSLRVGEDVISERCTKCGMPKEEYRYYYRVSNMDMGHFKGLQCTSMGNHKCDKCKFIFFKFDL